MFFEDISKGVWGWLLDQTALITNALAKTGIVDVALKQIKSEQIMGFLNANIPF